MYWKVIFADPVGLTVVFSGTDYEPVALVFDMKKSVIRSTQLHMYCRLQHIA